MRVYRMENVKNGKGPWQSNDREFDIEKTVDDEFFVVRALCGGRIASVRDDCPDFKSEVHVCGLSKFDDVIDLLKPMLDHANKEVWRIGEYEASDEIVAKSSLSSQVGFIKEKAVFVGPVFFDLDSTIER